MSRASGRSQAVEQVTEVFRSHGYAGASLSALSDATGLGRSSLYHYFPGGKGDMARASLSLILAGIETLERDVLALTSVTARLGRLADGLDALYAGGATPCLLGAFSVGIEPSLAGDLTLALRRSINLMIRILMDSGKTRDEARLTAEDATARVQGALILDRTLGDSAAFQRALGAIRTLDRQ